MKFFVSVLLPLLATSLFAQVKLSQTFETATFPPTSWSLEFSGTVFWERATVGGYNTSSASTVFLFYEASAFETQSLITHTFTATTSGDSLSFDHAYATFQSEIDSLIIEISDNGGTSYSRLVALQGGATVGVGMVTAPPNGNSFQPTSASEWGKKRYSLPVGTNRIRFRAISAYGNNLYLDNIRVGPSTVTFNHFGTNAGVGNQLYYYVNSIPGNGAPAQPQFRWRDTTGSSDLIVNGVAVAPINGDLDEGYFKFVNLFPGKRFRLFGKNFGDSLFLNTNGIISFTQFNDSAFIPSAIPSPALPNAAIYPLWADYDFSDPDVPTNKLSYKIDGDFFIVTFANAPRYNVLTDATDYVSFQVVMRFSTDTSANSFALVQFDSSRTGSSFRNAYSNDTFDHLVGMENATGSAAVSYRYVKDGASLINGPLFGSSLAVTMGPSYSSDVKLALKGFLEGPYSIPSHAMTKVLQPQLPLTQPYNSSPWNYTGLEIAGAAPMNAVDWALIELRAGTTGSTKTAQRAGWILSNGSIVDMNGTSPLQFDLMPSGNYYALIHHRNHLGIMSSAAIALGTSSTAYDFTTNQSQAYGTQPMNQLESGVFGMVAGDANRSSEVSSTDATNVLGGLNANGYLSQDVNLSGITSSADLNLVFGNLARNSQVPAGAISNPSSQPQIILDTAFDSSKPNPKRRNLQKKN